MDIHIRRCSDFCSRTNHANIGHGIREKALEGAHDTIIVRYRGDRFLCIGLAGLTHLAGGGSARSDFYIFTGDSISSSPIFSHVDLRIGTIADVPRVELRIGGGVDGHVSRISCIDDAVIDGHASHAHSRAGRSHFDIAAVSGLGCRRNIGRFDDEHAAMLRVLRIRLQVGRAILYGNTNLSAIRKDRTMVQCEIVVRFHDDLAAVRLYRPAAGKNIFTGRKDDAVCGLRCFRSTSDAIHIHQTVSIVIGGLIRRRVIKYSAGAKNTRCFITTNIDIILIRNQKAVSYIDSTFHIDRNIFLCGAETPIGAIFQSCCPFREGLTKEIRPIHMYCLISGNRSIATIKKHLPCHRIGAQSEPAYIDDAGGAYRDAFIREEIHIAADLPIFDGVHYAIDIDFIIDHVDLVSHIPQVEIGNICLIQAKLIESVQRLRAIGAHLLVVDFIFLPVRPGNRSLYHRRPILRRIRHSDRRMSHRPTGRRHGKSRQDAGLQ